MPADGSCTLRPALSTDGFANELGDLLSRCAERGWTAAGCKCIGRLSGAGMVAAGRFAQQYEQVMLLRGGRHGRCTAGHRAGAGAAELPAPR